MIKQALTVIFLAAIIYSQENELTIVTPEIRTRTINNFPNPIDTVSTLRNLILACNIKPDIQSTEPTRIETRAGKEQDINGISSPCYYEKWESVTSFDELISLNPNNNTIWPGATIQGRSLPSGSLDLVPLNRNKGRITLTGLTFDDDKPNYSDVEIATESDVKESIRKLIKRKDPITAANFAFSATYARSVSEAMQGVGVSTSGSWGHFKTLLSKANYDSKNVFVVKLTQNYYSLSFSNTKLPATPESIFSDDTKVEDAKLYMGLGNPPALITNVNYGRIMFLIIESSEKVEEVENSISSSFTGWGIDGKVNFSQKSAEILSNSKISLYAIGGDASQVSQVITSTSNTTKTEILKDYIESGAQYSRRSPGVPIGYKAVYLANNHIASIESSMRFQTVRCDLTPYKKPLKVTVERFVTRDVSDDDEDMSFSYLIEFLGQQGNVIGRLTDGISDKYVEEVGKVGVRRGVNHFFEGQNTIVNKPVFSVRCTINARSHDGDCSKAWRNGATISRTFELPELEGKRTFTAWGGLDLHLMFN